MFVFLLGGFAPSYVPLRFVPVQDLFHLEVAESEHELAQAIAGFLGRHMES